MAHWLSGALPQSLEISADTEPNLPLPYINQPPSPQPSPPQSPPVPRWSTTDAAAPEPTNPGWCCHPGGTITALYSSVLWHISHKAWNQLMHALHGNGSKEVILVLRLTAGTNEAGPGIQSSGPFLLVESVDVSNSPAYRHATSKAMASGRWYKPPSPQSRRK